MIPLLTYAENRALREKIYRAYCERGNNNDDLDNKEILREESTLRARRAQLLGYNSHADNVLDDNMAKTPKTVYGLLDVVNGPRALEAECVTRAIDAEGGCSSWRPGTGGTTPKGEEAKYEFDDAVLRPYFQLDNVIKGVRRRIALGSPRSARSSQVQRRSAHVRGEGQDGSHSPSTTWIIFRARQRNGVDELAHPVNLRAKDKRPVVVNGQPLRPTAEEPSLLSLDEGRHLPRFTTLHGICQRDLEFSGTSVANDFVERRRRCSRTGPPRRK
jgi:peptidyl-dipeptidase Dcp